MNGVLNIDKPAGMTSHDVVARVRRLAHLKRVGHAGTLDPDATGVLLVCLGQATRISDFLADEGKAYRAILSLGVTTTTEDASGQTIATSDASSVTADSLAAALPQFLGRVMQTPPMVSAVHHEGRRLYDLARQGIEVERQARPVTIDSIVMSDFTAGPQPTAVLEIVCGKGTYIRTLCADLGAALGVGGHMASLRRTRVGAFDIAGATPLDLLSEENIAAHLVPPADALSSLPSQVAGSDADLDAIRHGRALATTLGDGAVARVLDPAGALIALARVESRLLCPFKVFALS